MEMRTNHTTGTKIVLAPYVGDHDCRGAVKSTYLGRFCSRSWAKAPLMK